MLHSLQESAEDLVLALSIVFVGGFAEKGAEFVFADGVIGQRQELEHVFGGEIERNFQFSENDIVGESLFYFGLGALFFSSFVVDQTIEEKSHGGVVTRQVRRIGFLFHPVANLRPSDLVIGRCENGDHFVITEIECVPDTPHNIVVGHLHSQGCVS